MSSAVATLDPSAAIAAAVRELYDQLVELIGRGPTDDPGLLDELAALTRPIRSRITRARKREVAADGEPSTAPKPAPAQAPPTKTPVTVAPTSTAPTAGRSVPAATGSTPESERDSVRLLEPKSAPTPAAPRRAAGRRRKQARYLTHRTAHAAWKYIRGALAALALGAIGTFGGRGMAEAGVSAIWIWLWGIAFFAAFVGGLSFWAMRASQHWGQEVAAISAETTSAGEAAAAGVEPAETPRQVIAWEDESDRGYRDFLELHRPANREGRDSRQPTVAAPLASGHPVNE